MAKALSGNTAVRPINARPGGAIKKGVPRDLFVRGTPVEGAVTYFPTFAVSSAWQGLTSLFGMGRGGSLALWPPEFFCPYGSLAIGDDVGFSAA